MAVHEVLGLTDQVLERSMSSVRRALILAAGVASEIERVLLSDDYAEPRGLVPALHVVTGQLILKDPTQPPPPNLASVEFDYPRPAPKATETPEGQVNIDFPATLTALQLPTNVAVQITGTGLRAAHMTPTGQPRVDSIRGNASPPRGSAAE
jgi:hypothetical protein